MPTKPSHKLTLHDRLSRLALPQAKKLLGESGAAVLPKAGREEIDIETQVLFTAEQFQVVFPVPQVVVTIGLHPAYRDRLQIACSHEGETADYYRAATLSLILEEKLALGLAAPPDANTPWEQLAEHELEARAVAEREERARKEQMRIKSADRSTPWTDYAVSNALSGKTYRVALRGMGAGQVYCTCPDFRKNRLGLCKHVIKVRERARKRFTADTVVNIDLPWNPALLEQRIARAHRMGQKRKVQVYLLVTEGTIEENLLATLSAKHELASAVLDPDSDLREVQLASGMDELKRRLEVLLGAKPEGDPDVSQAREVETALAERKARVAEAGGQLFSAAFGFLGELMPESRAADPAVVEKMRAGLAECAETQADGSVTLNLKLKDSEALTSMAAALARLLAPEDG